MGVGRCGVYGGVTAVKVRPWQLGMVAVVVAEFRGSGYGAMGFGEAAGNNSGDWVCCRPGGCSRMLAGIVVAVRGGVGHNTMVMVRFCGGGGWLLETTGG
ncbi:leucine-rich repeat extensin-like protein 7 [Iris pallida]|uniref:Leucine-rich repeat extensin-like protein 7 n=1 Tax=Iris pallida TaxID=29817 RepID=A0AAX6GNC0_IRIPA|nr:leucine-rich repeat extensin-like protein 7 [Iris pallida]KAJ6837829.1 leucine-rich repeat extensin-like protein 7 [Iris pallida]